MSHAFCIVALSPDDTKAAGGDVQEAVDHQMEPFNEDGEWFADGSRWDWWVIGGRYSGRILGKDVANRGELTESALLEAAKNQAEKIAMEFLAEPEEQRNNPIVRHFTYGFRGDETADEYIQRHSTVSLSAYAFLKDRTWHEATRMGFFAMPTATECERKAEAKGIKHEGRCIHRCESTGAKIVSYGSTGDGGRDQWSQMFWPRFIRPLPDDYTLVGVDYHV